MTAYADSAPLHSDTTRNEPSFSHLTKLHLLLHRLSRVVSNSMPQIGNGSNCTLSAAGQGAIRYSSVVAFRYHDAAEDVLFIENSNGTATLHAWCWGHRYSLSPSSIQVASTTTGTVLFASDETPSTPAAARTYTPVRDEPFAWKAYSEPLQLAPHTSTSSGGGEIVVSSQPLEQLNLTTDLTGYCVYQTTFSKQELGFAVQEQLLVVTGRTNNAYVVAIDGKVVASLQSHQNMGLGQAILNTTVAMPTGGPQHTLTVVSSSLGLRNDDIFDSSREAKGIEQLSLGGLNLTARTWRQRAGLVGEKSSIESLQQSLTVANASMVWMQTSFALDSAPNGTAPTYVFDASGLGRGYVYVNNFSLGRYWPTVPRGSGLALPAEPAGPGQRYYHIPPDCLQAGTNTLVLIEEIGAPHPELARLATVAVAKEASS